MIKLSGKTDNGYTYTITMLYQKGEGRMLGMIFNILEIINGCITYAQLPLTINFDDKTKELVKRLYEYVQEHSDYQTALSTSIQRVFTSGLGAILKATKPVIEVDGRSEVDTTSITVKYSFTEAHAYAVIFYYYIVEILDSFAETNKIKLEQEFDDKSKQLLKQMHEMIKQSPQYAMFVTALRDAFSGKQVSIGL